ncbi:MAG: ribosome biogenesis GTPase YlqF [Firmicutes bacterium]|nr:ribosome biogenesis GTPase YlqF [Bacillota bacterium]
MSEPVIQWYPGHMARSKRTLEADLALVDMLIEVVDARIPAASRNPDLQPYLRKKCHLLLLNKADLADPSSTQRWLAYYKKLGCVPASINAARKQGVKEMLAAIELAAAPLREKLARKNRLQRAVRAMVVGVPNCGKSTVINALSYSASAKTGNKPGVTRGRQWVKTKANIELLDTPGLLWPRFAGYDTAYKLAVCGCIADNVFPVYQVACGLAEQLCSLTPDTLRERYKLDELPSEGAELVTAVGRSRGLLGAQGKVREEDAALLLLQEYRSGRLGRITLEQPPKPVPAAPEADGSEARP